jgi:hypothetical protein
MKSASEFLVEDIARLIKAELRQRKEQAPDPDVVLKLALIAKIGLLDASRGLPVPSGGSMQVATTRVVAAYLTGEGPVLEHLRAPSGELRRVADRLSASQPRA